MQKTLNAKLIAEATPPAKGEIVIADEGIPGYQLKVTRAGHKILSLLYWSPVEAGKRRRLTIGQVGAPVTMPDGSSATLTAYTGRQIAEAARGLIRAKRDPYLEREQSARAEEVAESERQAKKLAAQPVRVVAERFLSDATERGLSARTIGEWKRLLAKHVLPIIGNVSIIEVGKADALAVKRAMPRGRNVLANRVQQVCCSLLNFAEDERGVTPNPFAVGVRGKNRWYVEVETRQAFTREEIGRLFAALDAEQDVDRGGAVDAIRLLALTGWRKGEVLSLKREDIDFASGAATLRQHKTSRKTGRSVRALSPSALALLNEIPERGDWVFPSPDDVKKHRQEIKRTWNKVRAVAGLSKPLHSLRHSAATIALSEGVPLATVGALLGHRNAATTLRYAKTEHEAALGAAAVLGAAIKKATTPADVTPIYRKAKHK